MSGVRTRSQSVASAAGSVGANSAGVGPYPPAADSRASTPVQAGSVATAVSPLITPRDGELAVSGRVT